ncbi:uncharacterized protein LOC123011851 [Tribolium madens]|uniref:uncharacterized protein LOC123011851 n=1 Tax=Tribolium madens TaxID=41895 RepID=UPI001CF759A0|nr:uncharacterized protein LOC123011851 [Tribolium madens]
MLQKLFLFLICVNTFVSSHILHFYYCRPPNVCTEIPNCPNASQGYSLFTAKRTYCGFIKNVPKICCVPVEPTEATEKMSENITNAPRVYRVSEDLVNHQNFDFLPMDKCGQISNGLRITSGTRTSPGEFPWMALIAYKTGNSSSQRDFRCGGTLITVRYVLTAAHCIENTTIMGVRLGEYNIMTDPDCDPNGQNCESPVQDISIDKAIIHPFYDPTTFINDIALIRLDTPANYSYENVKPICLPFGELLHAKLEEQEMTVAGWGATEDGAKSMVLRKVSVPVMAREECQILYHDLKPITKKQICAGADHGKDSCSGDSGSPLKRIDLINGTPRYVQYGIVSFGPTHCGIGGRPGIYTNVQKYMKWILDNLEYYRSLMIFSDVKRLHHLKDLQGRLRDQLVWKWSVESMACDQVLFKFYVFVLIHLIVITKAQWVVEDEGCTTPDGASGTCISIYSCKNIMDVLDKVPQPIPARITNLLKSYHCGFDGRNPKVCCPAKPIVLDLVSEKKPDVAGPPNVSRHKNIGLLPKNCGYFDTDNKIVNGNKTGLFEFPWMALLSYRTARGPQFKCGATIINERYILTAAHCITNNKYPLIGVRVGDHNIQTQKDCELTSEGDLVCAPPYQDLSIEEIIPHPSYDTALHTNDVGLLRVTRMNLSLENTRPVCLPLDKARNYNFTNRNCVVTGWGVTETGRSSPDLLKVQIPIVSHEECNKLYQDVTKITHQQLCAGGKTKGDSCGGDSGGPLHVMSLLYDDTRLVQQGIVSFGPRNCGAGVLPGVYTRVAYYMDWILDNMKS